MDEKIMSYEDILYKLKEQNLNFTNENLAIKSLQTISYYSLYNGYKKLFMVENDENKLVFKNHTYFEHLLIVYHFDYELQNVLFKFIIRYEILIKNVFSDVISKYSKNHTNYLAAENYKDPRSSRTMKTLQELKDVIENSKKQPTKHYRTKYNTVPPWIATKNMYLGHMESWYWILKTEDKVALGKSFLKDAEKLEDDEIIKFINTSLSIIRDYRNIFAHGNRTLSYKSHCKKFDFNILQKILPSGIINQRDFFRKKYMQNDLFSLIFILMVSFPNELDRNTFYEEIIKVFKQFLEVPLIMPLKEDFFKFINLPNNILDRIEKLHLS